MHHGQQQHDGEKTPVSTSMSSSVRKYLPVAAVAIVGVTVTLVASIVVGSHEERELRLEFNRLADRRNEAVRYSINAHLQVLEAISALYDASDLVRREQFSDFVRPLLARHRGIQALEWIPRIRDEERDTWEQAVVAEGFEDFSVTERSPDNSLVPAARRDEYFPVHYVEPLTDNEAAHGFDLASNPTRLAALNQARDTGLAVATARITLVQEKSNQYGMLVFVPKYHGDSGMSRRDDLIGFVLGVFRLGDVMAAAIGSFEAEGINSTLVDLAASDEEQWLAQSGEFDEHGEPSNLQRETVFEVGSRSWQLVTTAGPQFVRARRTRSLFWVLTNGVVLTVLVGGYIVLLIGRTSRIERLVRADEAQRRLREHRDHLEELVAERTADLESSHEQLRQSERLATIGTLAAGLGHDMNNILFPVRCRLDTLQAQRLGEHTSEELAAICVSIDYLQHLSNGLHQLALNPDDSHASTVCTHMTIWVKDTWALLRSALPVHATLECEFADDLPPLAVPPHQMTQAIFNLVVNAGEAIGDHGTVRISAETRDSGQTVCISVSDDGHGMSTEVTKRALDPFFTTKTRGLSTGLGLALVQGVAASAGGHVEINSTPGGGATIGLCVPVADEPEGSGRALGERSLHATVSVHDRRMATMFSSILENAGFEVSHAGDEAASDSSLWVADASVATPEAAALFLDGSESGRIIVLGPASDAWDKHRVTVVDGTAGVEAIRTAISGILSRPAEIGS